MRRREETPTSRATQPKWLRPRTFSKFLDENYLVKPRFLSDAAKRRMYRVRMWPDRVVLVKHHVSPVSGPPLRVLLRFLRRNLSSKSGKLELAAQDLRGSAWPAVDSLADTAVRLDFFGLGPRAQRAARWKVFCYGLRAAPCTSSRPVLRAVQRAPQRTAQREFELFILCKLTSN